VQGDGIGEARAGVGRRSTAERAGELGGVIVATPTVDDGRTGVVSFSTAKASPP
jgi:hypothetical protein